MSFNETPSLFFIITFPQKMKKHFVLSHKVNGSQTGLKFKISYVYEKNEKFDNEMYSIIIATYTNNLENNYKASIIADFGDKKYMSKKLNLKNGTPYFCYDLNFQDENGNKLKSLDTGIQYNIFNEYIPRQKNEIQEKLHKDTKKSITNDIEKNKLISPNLYYSVLSNSNSDDDLSSYLINKFDYSIFQEGTINFGNELQKSMIETMENNNKSNPDIKVGKLNAYFYYFNDRENFDEHLSKDPLSIEVAQSIAENEQFFPQLNEVSENIISLCNNVESIEKILSQTDDIDTILSKLDMHHDHISKIVEKENKPLNIKFNKSQIVNYEPEKLFKKYKNLWNYENKNKLSLSNLTLNEVINTYMDANKNDLSKLTNFKQSFIENIEDDNKEIRKKINKKIHNSAKELNKKKKMNTNEILDVMTKYDEHYYNKDYDTSEKELEIIDNIKVNEIDQEFTEKYRQADFNVIFKDNFDAFIKKLFEKSNTFNDLKKLINLYDTDNKQNIPRVVSKTMEITFVAIFEVKTDEKKEMNDCFKNIIEINNANNNNINEFLDEIEKVDNTEKVFSLYNNKIELFKSNSNLNNAQERIENFIKDKFNNFIENFNSIQTDATKQIVFDYLSINYIITTKDFYSTELSQNFNYMNLLNKNNVFTTPKYSSEKYVKETKEVVKEIKNEFDEGNYEIEKIPDIKNQKDSGILKEKLNAINFGDTKKAEEEEDDGIERINESEREKEKLNEKKKFYDKFFKEFEMCNKLNNITSSTKVTVKEVCTFITNNSYIEEVTQFTTSFTLIEPSKFFQIYFSNSKQESKEELKIIDLTLTELDKLKSIFNHKNPKVEIPVTNEQKEILSQFINLEELHNEFNILKAHFKMENIDTEQIENSLFESYVEKLIKENEEIKIDNNTNFAKQEALFDTNFEKLKLNITITTELNAEYDIKIFLIEDEVPEKLIREVKNIKGKNNETINIMKDTSFPYKFERNQQIKISIDKLINRLVENKIMQIPIGTLMVNKNANQSIFSNELININCEEDELSKGRLITLNFQANGSNFDREKKIFYTITNQNKTIFKSALFAMEFIKPLIIPSRLLTPNFDIDLYQSLNNNNNNFKKVGNLKTTVEKIVTSKTIELNSDGKKINMSVVSTIVKYTFVDFIIKMNGRFNVAFAIDFTGSNYSGLIDRHCYKKDESENYYIKAIKLCGTVLDEYSSDHIFPTFGFGAVINDNVSHCMNVNFQDNPGISTLDNVIQEYRNCLKKIGLGGPTYICPIIDNFKNIINNNKSSSIYNILMIITDGIINDINKVIDSVVNAQSLPLSINIIGIGDEPTTEMRKLNMEYGPLYDSNNKRMDRKVVTYIHFKQYKDNFNLLKNELMKTIPENVIEYLNEYNKMKK